MDRRNIAIACIYPQVLKVNHQALIFVIPTRSLQLKNASWISGIRCYEHLYPHEEIMFQK